MPGPHTLLLARGLPAVAFVADLTNRAVVGTLQTEPEIDLRAPSNAITQLDALTAAYAARLPFDEMTIAPRGVRVVDRNVEIQLAVSTYSRFLAARDVFGQQSAGAQRQEFVRYSIGTPPWFAHSLGVNCTLETADAKLIWSQRGPVPVEPDRFVAAMGEGARFEDAIDGVWNPETTARRGFHEELGFPLDSADILDITFHSLVAQFGNGGHSITGHAVTKLSLQEVLYQHQDAMDANENPYGFFVCDANDLALEAFLEVHPVEDWTTWGTANVWDLATHRLNTKVNGLELQPIDAPIYVK